MKYDIFKSETPEDCQILEAYECMSPNPWIYGKLENEMIYRSFTSFCLGEDWKCITLKPKIEDGMVDVFSIIKKDLAYLGSIEPPDCATTLSHFARVHKCVIDENLAIPETFVAMWPIISIDCNEDCGNLMDSFIQTTENNLYKYGASINLNWSSVLHKLLNLELIESPID